jgi:hypothetical protein
VNSEGAYCIDGQQECELVKWSWPEGDLVEDIVVMWRENRGQ